MRFRKLRIAWSVFWGLAAVLLIVLWVRSYSTMRHPRISLLPIDSASSLVLWQWQIGIAAIEHSMSVEQLDEGLTSRAACQVSCDDRAIRTWVRVYSRFETQSRHCVPHWFLIVSFRGIRDHPLAHACASASALC